MHSSDETIAEKKAEDKPEEKPEGGEDEDKEELEEDPEDWIRNHIIGKNMLMKANFMGKMGFKVSESLSKDALKKMTDVYETERKQLEEEEKEINETLRADSTYSNGDFNINFFVKTDEEMRANYINKVFGMLKVAQPAKKHQTMIIFDWDDTLLPTTFLGSLGFLDIPKEILETLKPLDDASTKLLARSVGYGDTFIITNSAEGWVQYSSKLFMPKTHDIIVEKRIKVISARTDYENMFPGDSTRWKMEAFLKVKKLFDSDVITNLICLGDSHIEMDAAHVLGQQFKQAMIKTIKFRESPKPDELMKQQELVNDKFEQIYTAIRNLTIRLEKKGPGQ